MADLNFSNMSDEAILAALLERANPETKRRMALISVAEAGLKLGTDTKYSRAVADSRDMVFGAVPTEAFEVALAKIPENVFYTVLSQGDGTVRGSAAILDLPTNAKGVRVKISVHRDAEAVPVKDKAGKPITLESGATKTKQEYLVTECAGTLDGKGRLPQFTRAPETEESEGEGAEAE